MEEATILLLLCLPASMSPATIPLVSQQAVDFIAVVLFLWCVECAYLHSLQTLWNMLYSVAYAERLFIGRVDCDARFTHAVAKAFFQNMSKKKRAASPCLWAVCLLIQLGDSEVQFPNSSKCHYSCWTNCHWLPVPIPNIHHCETRSERDICLSVSPVFPPHL